MITLAISENVANGLALLLFSLLRSLPSTEDGLHSTSIISHASFNLLT